MPSGKPTPRCLPELIQMRRLELLVPPPLLAAGFVGLVWLTARYDLVHATFPGQWIVGLTLVSVGSVISFLGIFELVRARTTINPMHPGSTTTVVSAGIYRLSRNPMYLGLALAGLGFAIWQSALVGYPLVVACCTYLTRFQIIPEERALVARFGIEFREYMSRVRRWI